MKDYFALLGEARRPWVEPEKLKETFLILAAKYHPDKAEGVTASERQVSQDRYADLNAAYNSLREPKSRLQHLLELERGEKPQDLQEFPAELSEIFFQVSNICRQADQLIAEMRTTLSSLLKVSLFERGQEVSEQIRELIAQLDNRREQSTVALKALDTEWNGLGSEEINKRALLNQLEGVYRLFGFYSKWTESLRQRLLELSVIE